MYGSHASVCMYGCHSSNRTGAPLFHGSQLVKFYATFSDKTRYRNKHVPLFETIVHCIASVQAAINIRSLIAALPHLQS